MEIGWMALRYELEMMAATGGQMYNAEIQLIMAFYMKLEMSKKWYAVCAKLTEIVHLSSLFSI